MRFLVFVWVAVELLQLAVIAALVVSHRKLERRLREVSGYEERPPRSVTDG
jgi:heme exporter protein D